MGLGVIRWNGKEGSEEGWSQTTSYIGRYDGTTRGLHNPLLRVTSLPLLPGIVVVCSLSVPHIKIAIVGCSPTVLQTNDRVFLFELVHYERFALN